MRGLTVAATATTIQPSVPIAPSEKKLDWEAITYITGKRDITWKRDDVEEVKADIYTPLSPPL